ncbi:MAG: hypothetical protein ACRDC1_16700, partial [Cetobacterium sp.]
ASLDTCSIKYLGKFIEKNKIGKVAEAGNIEEMKESFLKLAENINQYEKKHFKNIYFENFDINKLANKIKKGVDENNV